MAKALEKRLLGVPEQERIGLAFRLAYGRPPELAELTQAEKLVRAYGLAAFARALFNANEFLYVY